MAENATKIKANFAKKFFNNANIAEGDNDMVRALKSITFSTMNIAEDKAVLTLKDIYLPKHGFDKNDVFDVSKAVLKYSKPGGRMYSLTGGNFVNLQVKDNSISALEYYKLYSFPETITIHDIKNTMSDDNEKTYPYTSYNTYKKLKSKFIKDLSEDEEFDALEFYNSLDKSSDDFAIANVIPRFKENNYKDIIIDLPQMEEQS